MFGLFWGDLLFFVPLLALSATAALSIMAITIWIIVDDYIERKRRDAARRKRKQAYSVFGDFQ